MNELNAVSSVARGQGPSSSYSLKNHIPAVLVCAGYLNSEPLALGCARCGTFTIFTLHYSNLHRQGYETHYQSTCLSA
jgi:hypothetical protein